MTGFLLPFVVMVGESIAYAGESDQLAMAETAYAQGRYAQAASLASQDNSPVAAVLMAKSLLTQALLLDEDDPRVYALATMAVTSADFARAGRPDLVEAHLDAAIARGLQANHIPTSDAIEKVNEARMAIDRAMALAPDDPNVLATDGGWHLALTGKLGVIAANLLFSASRERGLAAFRRAFALSPNNSKMLYHFAKVRMMQDDADALVEARAALNQLQGLAAGDPLVASLQALAPALSLEIAAAEDARARPEYQH